MAGLIPRDSHSIARMVVEFSTCAGACVIDIPAALGLDACGSAFEIIVREKDVSPDSICITPTEPIPPLADPNTPINPRPSLDGVPAPPGNGGQTPSRWTTSWPIDPGTVDHDNRKTLPKPNDPAEDDPPCPDDPVEGDPAVPQPPVTRLSHPGSKAPVSSLQPSDPAKGTPSPTPVSVKEQPSAPKPPVSTSSSSSLSSSPSSSSSASSSGTGIPSPSPSSSPPTRPSETTSSIITKVITTSPLPPPPQPNRPQDPPAPPPSPSPSSTPQRPPQPSRPTQSSTSTSKSTPTPTPTPTPPPTPSDPSVCDSAYTSIDVSELTGLDPDFFSKYLGLLGLGHLLDSLVNGVLGNLLGSPERAQLVHQFRVRCDVDMPEGPAPAFPDLEEHRGAVPDGHRGCLESCERQVVHMAGLGVLQECVGVAYRDGPGPEGEGECRFWSGRQDEHRFLPVERLPGAKGRPGDARWQVIYM